MKVEDLLEVLQKINPEAEVYITDHCSVPQEANIIFVADEELNGDGELEFCELGLSLGDKAVLIAIEDKD